MRRLLGDLRDGLDGRGPRADHRDPLAGEVDALVRPRAGVVALAGEGVDARELRGVRRGQTAHRGDQEAGRGGAAVRQPDVPAIAFRGVDGGDYPRVELDVPAQVHLVGDEFQVAEDLRLGGVALRPVPLAEDLLGHAVAEHVVDALAVAAGARVAIPVPGAAYAAALFVHPDGQPLPAQRMQHVQAGEARAHHDRVEFRRLSFRLRCHGCLVFAHRSAFPASPCPVGRPGGWPGGITTARAPPGLICLGSTVKCILHLVNARCPDPPVHTTWLPCSCSSSDMVAAAMQYEAGTGGTRVTEALSVAQWRVASWRRVVIACRRSRER